MDRRLVLFLHIPKAAGSTLNRIIAQQFAPEAIYKTGRTPRPQLLAEVAAMTPASPVRVITGHFVFGLHASLPQPSTYITVLRDPVKRLLSQYRFVKRLERHPMHEAVASGAVTVHDFAKSLGNTQTRYLSGSDSPELDAAALALAKENLTRHFSAVGLAERFDESVVLFGRTLGWRVRTFTDSNVAPRRASEESVSADDLAAIRASTALDLELYRFAEARFAADLAALGPDFRLALTRLRWARRCRQLLGRLRS
jgi:hypothetical protein